MWVQVFFNYFFLTLVFFIIIFILFIKTLHITQFTQIKHVPYCAVPSKKLIKFFFTLKDPKISFFVYFLGIFFYYKNRSFYIKVKLRSPEGTKFLQKTDQLKHYFCNIFIIFSFRFEVRFKKLIEASLSLHAFFYINYFNGILCCLY